MIFSNKLGIKAQFWGNIKNNFKWWYAENQFLNNYDSISEQDGSKIQMAIERKKTLVKMKNVFNNWKWYFESV